MSRRSVIEFLREGVSVGLLKNVIKVVNSVPPKVNKQPRHFTIVKNNLLKEKIRNAEETEWQKYYKDCNPDSWFQYLKKLIRYIISLCLRKRPF